MSQISTPWRTGLLLSGGLDSVVLLNQLLCSGQCVVPFYIRTGCVWQACEIDAIEKLIVGLARPEIAELVQFDLPLKDLYGDHWSITGEGVPDCTTDDDAVYLPGRNPLLLIKPALWCHMHDIGQLALATLAANPFRDATGEFFARFEAMLDEGLGSQVRIVRPLEHLSKSDVMELGRHLPLELTFSCLAPVDGLHCGRCNKCAERHRGFLEVGLADRTRYFAPPQQNPALAGQRQH